MNSELKNEIQTKIQNMNLPKSADSSWFYNFFNFLEDVNFHTNNIEKLLNLIFNPNIAENFNNSLIDKYGIKLKNYKYDNSVFFEYLKRKILKSGQTPQEYISEMLSFIDNEEKRNELSFIDLMVKYVVLRHSEDVVLDRGDVENFEKNEQLSSSLKIAGLTICNLHVERENEKEITCMDFRTAKGLTGIRLGSLLLYDMFKFALERDKHAVVYGFNVLISNTSAQKMYERFGGKFYKTKSDLDNNIFLTAEEYARSSDGVTGCVIFENKVMTEIVSREKPKLYTLQEYLHKFSPENQQSK